MIRRSKSSGFTLLELLVVVIVVGILAAVALPQFGGLINRARAAEGENTAGAILTAEFVYFQEFQTFTTTTPDLLVDVPVDGITLFNYGVAANGAVSSTVTATGQGQAAGIVVTATILANGTRQIDTVLP